MPAEKIFTEYLQNIYRIFTEYLQHKLGERKKREVEIASPKYALQ